MINYRFIVEFMNWQVKKKSLDATDYGSINMFLLHNNSLE